MPVLTCVPLLTPWVGISRWAYDAMLPTRHVAGVYQALVLVK